MKITEAIANIVILVTITACGPKSQHSQSKNPVVSKEIPQDGGVDVGNGIVQQKDLYLLDSKIKVEVPQSWQSKSEQDEQTIYVPDNKDFQIVITKLEQNSNTTEEIAKNYFEYYDRELKNDLEIFREKQVENPRVIIVSANEGVFLLTPRALDDQLRSLFEQVVSSARSEAIRKLTRITEELKKLREEILHVDRQKYPLLKSRPELKSYRILDSGSFPHMLGISGDGAYFAFLTESNEYGYGTDISYGGRLFSIGFAGCDFGYMADLGEDVEYFDSKTPEIKRQPFYSGLKNLLVVPDREAENGADFHNKQSYNGINISGVNFARNATVAANHYYLLRSINFSTWDVMVLMKVLEVDPEDKSVVITYEITDILPMKTCHSTR